MSHNEMYPKTGMNVLVACMGKAQVTIFSNKLQCVDFDSSMEIELFYVLLFWNTERSGYQLECSLLQFYHLLNDLEQRTLLKQKEKLLPY